MAPSAKPFSLPAFQSKDVRFWFLQVEAAFRTNNVKDQQTMFDSVITALDVTAAADVADILANPPEDSPYEALKTALTDRLAVSNATRIKRVLEGNMAIGDRSPSQHLRLLRAEAGSNFSEEVLRTIWLDSLPVDVRLVVSGVEDASLDKLAAMADRVFDVAAPRRTVASVASSSASSSSSTMQDQIDALTKQLAAFTKKLGERGRPATKKQSTATAKTARSRSRSRRDDSDDDDEDQCWYHRRFRDMARKCTAPCSAPWPLATKKSSASSSGNGLGQQ